MEKSGRIYLVIFGFFVRTNNFNFEKHNLSTMRKLSISILPLILIFFFIHCSSEKDVFSENVTNHVGSKPASMPVIKEDFTLLAKDHVLDSDLYLEGGILQNQNANDKFLKSIRKWQGMPTIGKDRLGNLYAAWITGGNGEGNENYLIVSLSKDKGRSWSQDKLIFYVNPEDSTRLMDPCFSNDKYGNLYMTWAKHVKKKNTKEWAASWYSKLSLSTDGDTINYSPPRKIAEGIMLNKPFYSKISDQVIFPIARWYEGNPELHQPFIYKANYGENNLINLTKVGAIPLNRSVSAIHEHMIVQLKDSTYLGMIRTLDGLYYSKSKDGDVWDYGEKFTALGATTPARFHLAKLKSGRLILIFNNSLSRSNMTICLSNDDGATWPYKMVLDESSGVSYPDMIETDNGVLNIVYDYIRSPLGTIHFVSVKEDDIVNNVKSNIFRTKISTLK
jgi:hypothetical protein